MDWLAQLPGFLIGWFVTDPFRAAADLLAGTALLAVAAVAVEAGHSSEPGRVGWWLRVVSLAVQAGAALGYAVAAAVGDARYLWLYAAGFVAGVGLAAVVLRRYHIWLNLHVERQRLAVEREQIVADIQARLGGW